MTPIHQVHIFRKNIKLFPLIIDKIFLFLYFKLQMSDLHFCFTNLNKYDNS